MWWNNVAGKSLCGVDRAAGASSGCNRRSQFQFDLAQRILYQSRRRNSYTCIHIRYRSVPYCTVGRSRSEAWGVHGVCGAYWNAVPFGSAVVEGSSWGWSWKGGAVENGGRGAGFVTTSHASR